MNQNFGSEDEMPDARNAPLSERDEARRKDIMAPFAMRRTATLHHAGARLAIKLEELPPFSPRHVPAEELRVGMIQDALTALEAALKDKGWSLSRHPGLPKHLAEPEPEEETACSDVIIFAHD